MIFAAFDYFKYCAKIGPYSVQCLRKMGANLATAESYETARRSLVLGDYVFVHPTRSVTSWAIMYLTHGSWSHVGIISTEGLIYEAVTSGVGQYPLMRYFDGFHWLLGVRMGPVLDSERLKDRMKEHEGRRYAYRKIRYLFVATITNEHPDYRLRFTVDIVIVLGLVIYFVPLLAIKAIAASIAVRYLLVLAINSSAYIRMALRFYRDYLERWSPQSHQPDRSSPNRLYRTVLRLRITNNEPSSGAAASTSDPKPELPSQAPEPIPPVKTILVRTFLWFTWFWYLPGMSLVLLSWKRPVHVFTLLVPEHSLAITAAVVFLPAVAWFAIELVFRGAFLLAPETRSVPR